MSNSLKATVTGLVTAVVAILAIFGFDVGPDIATAIIAIGVVVLGYFTNKPD